MRYFTALFILTLHLNVAAKDKPNFLFLLADDQRPDTISAFGNNRISTPNIDSLVNRGMHFTRASCSNPICVASRAEILTGTHGWENGFTAQPGDRMNEDRLSWWAQTLQDGGYETFYTGKWHTPGNVISRGFQDTSGFFGSGGSKWWKDLDDWKGFPVTGYRGWIFSDPATKEKFPDLGVGVTPDISSLFADAAIDVLENKRSGEKPFFLSVNFTAPHDPLFLPTGMEGKYSIGDMELPENYLPVHPFDHGNFGGRDEALLAWPRTELAVKDLLQMYYAVVADMDRQIGRILDALEATGELDNTYVIYSSDHGMSVGSHGLRGKQNMYEHTINVPLIVAGPGIEAGAASDAQVYLREVYPTTCELGGVVIPEKVTAKSFAPVLKGERATQNETIYGYFREYQRMIRRDDGWKLIYYPHLDKRQLFNVAEDPNEVNDLAGDSEFKKVEESLFAQLNEWRKEAGDPLLKETN